MSFYAEVYMRCDKCQAIMAKTVIQADPEKLKSARWKMEQKTKALELPRHRRRTLHFCSKCADIAP